MTKYIKSLGERFSLVVAPVISGIILTISYLPQIYQTYTTQDVTGHSLTFWILLNISLTGFVIQQWGMIKYRGNKQYNGFIVQLLNLFFGLVMLIGVLIFR